MFAPLRRYSGEMFMSDWAQEWLAREGGWESKIFELSQFNPITARDIRSSCTILEIAIAWKTMKALSEFAWNDKDA